MLSSFTKMMPPQKKVILKDMRPYILGGGKKKKGLICGHLLCLSYVFVY